MFAKLDFCAKSGRRALQTFMSGSNFSGCFSTILKLRTRILFFVFSMAFSTFPIFPLLAFCAFALLSLTCFPCFEPAIPLFISSFVTEEHFIRCLSEARLLPDPDVWKNFDCVWKKCFLKKRHKKPCLLQQTRLRILTVERADKCRSALPTN